MLWTNLCGFFLHPHYAQLVDYILILMASKAVMRSQNRVRKKSKLDQATLAFNSPPLLSDDASQSESAQQTSFLDTGTSQSNDLYNSTIDAATGANTSTTCKTSTRSISPLAEATKARKSKSTKLCSSSSFPFPPMRTMSSSSIGAAFNSPGAGPLDRILPSGAPTPASVAFLPPGSTLATTYENPDFPTPNMYELTLLLHSEPGIEAFWSNVVKIATTCYKAERVTLAIPSDSTDLENTPWGQKASFNMADNDRLSLTYLCGSQDRDHDDITFRKDYDEDYENHDQDGEGGEGGEDDESRYQGVAISKGDEHSPNEYGGKGNGEQIAVCNDMDPETIEPVQIDTNAETPFGPVTIGLHDLHDAASNSDWISVTSGMSPGDAPDPPPLKMDQREGSADRAYRSDESEVKGRVFPGLQPLNFEADALLDETGVSRVLQRGKTVVLSREYRDVKTHLEEKEQRRKGGVEAAKESPSPKSVKPGSKGPISPSVSGFGNLDLPKGSFKKASSQPSTPLFFVGKGGRRRRKPSSQDCYAHNPVMQFYSTQQHMHHVQSRTHSPNRSSPFEEYEQPVTSPWSQSPAPSPAPRQDASENPFFAQPKVDEETFNPVTTTPVYSAKEPVSAIGCESSWTVIHIPLVHPSQSKSLDSGSAFPATERSLFGSGSNMDLETHQKRAPIAILSMLSPVIPYPSNLIHSLSHFAPLVATAYSLASTHTSVVNQLDCLRKKRSSRRRPPMQRMSSYYAGGMQSPETILGSITSPSDTSSGFTVSNVASPMWDQVGVGGRGSPSQAGSDRNSMKSGNSIYATPGSPFSFAVSESAESYFTRGRPPIFSRQSSNGCVDGCGGCSIPSVANRGLDIDIYGSLDARLSNDGVASISDGNRQSCSSSPVSSTNPVPDDKTPTGKEAFIDKGKTSQKTENSIEPEKVCIRSRLRNHVGASHTYLHSYGADYATTFQNLAGTSTQSTRRRGSGKSGAKSIRLNLHAMPPPSNRLLRTIVDSIPVHVFTAVPDTGQLTWVNARMLAYRGTSPEKFLAAPWDAIHPEDKDEYMRRWGIAIRRGDPLSHQMRVRRFDGVYRWFMVRAVPLRDQRGIIVHWFGTNMDIHDQRLAEVNAARQAEMAESESKYRSLANSSPQIVFAATANDGITFANTQWLGYSGQTLEQAMKLGFMGQVHPSDRHKCCLPGNDGSFAGMSSTTKFSSNDNGKAPLEKDSPAGGTYSSTDDDKPTFSTELRLQDKYGDYRWHLVRCVSVGSKVDNRQGLWFGTCTDINDHKLLEQKLKEANEAAQRTMESKTRFLANMSHEIRKIFTLVPLMHFERLICVFSFFFENQVPR
jgi:PAS domain S-box-containing protein